MHDEPRSTQRNKPSQDIGFFGRGAFTRQHVFAVAAKPFFCFRAVREALGGGRRRERLNGFVGAGMTPARHGRFAVATRALPLLAMAGFEKRFAL